MDWHAPTNPQVAAYSLGRRFNRLLFAAVHTWLLDDFTYFVRYSGAHRFASSARHITHDHWLGDAISLLAIRKVDDFLTAFADGSHWEDLVDTNVELGSLARVGLEDEFAHLRDEACLRIVSTPLAIAQELEVFVRIAMEPRQKTLFELARIIDAAAFPPDLWRDVMNPDGGVPVSDPRDGRVMRAWDEFLVATRRRPRNYLLPDHVLVAVRPPGARWLTDVRERWAKAEIPEMFLDSRIEQLASLEPPFMVDHVINNLHLAVGVHLVETCRAGAFDPDPDTDADCNLD
jgi:hypothetical protein